MQMIYTDGHITRFPCVSIWVLPASTPAEPAQTCLLGFVSAHLSRRICLGAFVSAHLSRRTHLALLWCAHLGRRDNGANGRQRRPFAPLSRREGIVSVQRGKRAALPPVAPVVSEGGDCFCRSCKSRSSVCWLFIFQGHRAESLTGLLQRAPTGRPTWTPLP